MTQYDNPIEALKKGFKRFGGCKPLPAEERFSQSYIPVPESGCWIWIANTRPNGYGAIKVNGKATPAHRYSWSLINGDIKDGLVICHKCDTKLCVNPDHLFAGTHQQNIDDMVSKNRQSKGDRHSQSIKTRRRGEMNHRSVLTNESVVKIRSDCRPQRKIAADYGVSQALISAIKLYKTWSHI